MSNTQLILITLHQTWDTEKPVFNLEKCSKCTIYKRTQSDVGQELALIPPCY